MKRSFDLIDLSLRSPYVFEGQLRSKKKSAVLGFETSKGKFQAECSIFPGLHHQDLDLLQRQFFSLPDLPLPDLAFENLEQIIQGLSFLASTPANLRFAYEAICFHFWLAHDKLPEQMSLIGKKTNLQSPINNLITNPHEFDWKSFDQSSKCVKLKLGRSKKVEEDISLLLKLRQDYPQTRWRLDANEAYSLEDLKKWEKVLCDQIEYFENPCLEPAQWPKNSALPLALESSPFTKPSWWSAEIPLKAIVHKPSLSDGFFQTLFKMKNSPIPIILSSTFEGAMGLRDYLLLKELSGSTQTHGLGTWSQIISSEPTDELKQTTNVLYWARSQNT